MSYDYQLVVIGSGSGGKDAAILGARAGLRVLLVERTALVAPNDEAKITFRCCARSSLPETGVA
jgi:thioredoxin reductase